MKTPHYSYFNNLFSCLAIITISTFAASCGDDDEVNCSKIEQELIEVSLETMAAIADDDCEGIEAGYAAIIEVSKKGKSCDVIKALMDDYGVDTIAEFESGLNTDLQNDLENAGCNASAIQWHTPVNI